MDHNDRHAIDSLFDKLSQVERQAGPRDPEAEGFIRERLATQPGAPYFMAQTIVVQEQALDAAQQRIEALEHELASRPQSGGGGLFSSLFGNGSRPAPAPRQAMPQGGLNAAPGYGGQQPSLPSSGPSSGPWGQQNVSQPGGFAGQRGGGFLAGAAQTAMGVAGGVLLGNAIAGMFAGDTANAAEQPAEPAAPAEEQESDAGDFGMDDTEF